MAEPKCPKCGAEGVDNITPKQTRPTTAPPWHDIYGVVFCNQCGHVYGVFPLRT